MTLEEIKDPSFIKQLSIKELEALAEDIRVFLVEHISKTGGHLASNLGVVELTLAMHYVFDSPKDAFIFDVGHQAYTHKILTGRAKDFDTLRKHKGLSGYINYEESAHDLWESGHAGTAVSALHGFLYAKSLKQTDGTAIALVGDGSITSGMSFEALNILGSDPHHKGIIILNDNNMSISKNVGSLSNILTTLRGNKFIIKTRRLLEKVTPHFFFRVYRRLKRVVKAFFQANNIFEDLGYVYMGPINGNNIKTIIKTLNQAKKMKKSVVIHAITDKGKGYEVAEMDKNGTYHGVSPFDLSTGQMLKKTTDNLVSFSEVISEAMIHLQNKRKTFVVMPAMLVGTKFERFYEQYPDRLVDVGIAEEHAATMAAAMARNGIDVFLPLYATFAQRAYDQIMNDIARSDTKVIFGIDRAGFVGDDGSTHQGLFDVSMFYTMPNVVITMPKDAQEAFDLLQYGFNQTHPFVIRYPRAEVKLDKNQPYHFNDITPTWETIREGKAIILISYGLGVELMQEVQASLDIDALIVNARFIKPMDLDCLRQLFELNLPILVYEEAWGSGSLYPQILKEMANQGLNIKIKGMTVDDIIHHGTRMHNQMDAKMTKDDVIKVIQTLI